MDAGSITEDTEAVVSDVEEPPTAEPTPTPLPTSTPSPPKNLEPEIKYFTLELGTLCAGAQTIVEYDITDPENDALDISWGAQYGELSDDGDTVAYTAPAELPEEGFDRVTLTVSDGENSVTESMLVKLVELDATTAWQQTGGPEGGIMTSIEIDYANPDILFMGGVGGSVQKTIDGGENWVSSAQFLAPGERITQIFLNQDNTNILYVSAGRLFKSEDGGETFNAVLEPQPGISHMAMSAFDPDFLIVGTGGGGVLLTADGGRNWSNINFPIPPDSSVHVVGISTEEEFWVGTREWTERADGQLFHTTDKGSSWNLVDNMNQHPDSDIQSILVDPIDPNTVYVSLMQAYNEDFDQPNPRVVLKTTDGGDTWDALNLPELWDTRVNLMGVTEYDRTLYMGIGGTFMYKTPNGGESFEKLTLLGRNGDIYDMAIDPRDPDVFYFPSQSVGILKTTDGGKTFDWKNNGILFTSISLLEMETGAGNGTLYATSAGGEGQFRTFDHGETWERITENGITHPWADEIQINPHNPDEVWYVADIGKVEASGNQGDRWQIEIDTRGSGFRFGSVYAMATSPNTTGKLYALKNGFGIFDIEDWGRTRFFHHSEVDYSFTLAVHPEDDNIIVSGYIPKPFQDFAFVRASWDGGENWETLSQIDGSAGVTSAAFSPALPDRFYFASVGTQPTIYRSDEFGGTSAALAPPWDLAEVEEGEIHYIEVVPHPSQPDEVYVSAYPAGVFRSGDAGESWTRIDDGLPDYRVKDSLRQGRYNLTVSQSNPNTLYVGIYDEGVYKSNNGGESWQKTSVIASQEILALTIDPKISDMVYVGTEKGMYRSDNGGETWSEFMMGMQGISVRTMAWGNNGALFAGTLGYEIYFVDPGGNRWEQLPSLGQFGTFWPIWNDRPLYQYTFLIFHPEDPDVLVFGTFPAGIYISRDGGKSWHESNTNWSWDGVFSFAYHPEDSNILYSGTYNGVNRSLDGGQTWEMWDNGWPDEQWTFSIDFDPRDPNVMYACSKNGENEGKGQPGFFMGAVMKSTDGGETWFEIMRGLTKDQEYYKIIVDPYTPDVIYLASQADGIFISYDGGSSWKPWNEGLTTLPAGTNGNNVTNTMVLSPDGLHLYFATAGSGVFRRMTVNAAEVCGCNP